MGRKQINGEQAIARFPSGTIARVRSVLKDNEPLAAFIREAVERELQRREGGKS